MPQRKVPGKLTAKQRLFIKEYLVDKNASRAIMRAGFTQNLASAGELGYRMLKNVDVATVIRRELDKIENKIEVKAVKARVKEIITKEQWLKRLKEISMARISDFCKFDKKKKLVPIPTDEIPKSKLSAVKRMTQSWSESDKSSAGSRGLELHDPIRALDLIGKSFGWVKETIETSGKDGGPIQYENLSDEKLSELENEVEESLAVLKAAKKIK